MLVKLVQGGSPTQHTVSIGDLDLYFSYETVVAFETMGLGLVVSENMWSTTTSKHINAIAGANYPRFPREKFKKMLKEVLMPITMAMGD